ncbi:molybdate ABC transporter substrate-binding protein [Alteromonas ponticola]|uniref:Molybdate ABC transporter substrate-binding protein n=1 Tax=Alteromonas ponticola TaxID=2720613 RepID=A0ABX1R5K8_9ALTE|nr:molybdate ABC transporter substrate-binding protein [Alteromonas ponticola]NMH61196.1 molybdate ABC transporter substrate-binding protein [Alteromonas ponticola]
MPRRAGRNNFWIVVSKLVLIVCLLLRGISVNAKPLHIAVSSNFSGSLQQLLATPAFSEFEVITSEGASGTLYAQTMQGAPFDIFLSADAFYVDALIENKRVVWDQSGIYAKGRLAYIDRLDPAPTLDSLKTYALAANKKLAIAEPDLAPYGKAAEQFLSTVSLWQQVLPSIVYGRNVMQVYNYYQTRHVDNAIVAYALVYDNQQHVWLIPEHYHEPIVQKWAILATSKHPKATQFVELLLSNAIQTRLSQKGYDRVD